jgi:hypothetical protein
MAAAPPTVFRFGGGQCGEESLNQVAIRWLSASGSELSDWTGYEVVMNE